MNDLKAWMIALQILGPVITIGVLLLANARAGARQEERVKGLGRALDTDRKKNTEDHDRFYDHILNQRG